MIRKVETMNPNYILREQGAVLNWFDITEIEGRFSLNDKLGDIFETFGGKLFVIGIFFKLFVKFMQPRKSKDGKKTTSNGIPSVNKGMIDMMFSFTVIRFLSMLGMRNISFTKEEMLDLNKQLNKIQKPKK